MDWKQGLTAAVVVGLGYLGFQNVRKGAESFSAEMIQYELLVDKTGKGIEEAEIISTHSTLEDAEMAAKEHQNPTWIAETRFVGNTDEVIGSTIIGAESFGAEKNYCWKCGLPSMGSQPPLKEIEVWDSTTRREKKAYSCRDCYDDFSTYFSAESTESESFSADTDDECNVCGKKRKHLDTIPKEFGVCPECSQLTCMDCDSDMRNEWGVICELCANRYDAESFSAEKIWDEVSCINCGGKKGYTKDVCEECGWEFSQGWEDKAQYGRQLRIRDPKSRQKSQRGPSATPFIFPAPKKGDAEKCSVCGDVAVHILKKGEIVLCDKHYQQQFGKYSAESFAAPYPRKYGDYYNRCNDCDGDVMEDQYQRETTYTRHYCVDSDRGKSTCGMDEEWEETEESYAETDESFSAEALTEYRYVPCPRCGLYDTLRLTEDLEKTKYYTCIECNQDSPMPFSWEGSEVIEAVLENLDKQELIEMLIELPQINEILQYHSILEAESFSADTFGDIRVVYEHDDEIIKYYDSIEELVYDFNGGYVLDTDTGYLRIVEKKEAESFSADDKKVKQALKRVGPLANEVQEIGKTLKDSLKD